MVEFAVFLTDTVLQISGPLKCTVLLPHNFHKATHRHNTHTQVLTSVHRIMIWSVSILYICHIHIFQLHSEELEVNITMLGRKSLRNFKRYNDWHQMSSIFESLNIFLLIREVYFLLLNAKHKAYQLMKLEEYSLVHSLSRGKTLSIFLLCLIIFYIQAYLDIKEVGEPQIKTEDVQDTSELIIRPEKETVVVKPQPQFSLCNLNLVIGVISAPAHIMARQTIRSVTLDRKEMYPKCPLWKYKKIYWS